MFMVRGGFMAAGTQTVEKLKGDGGTAADELTGDAFT